MEDSKISSRTRSGFERYRGLATACALLAAAAIASDVVRDYAPASWMPESLARSAPSPQAHLAAALHGALLVLFPTVYAYVCLWIAFANRIARDRYLWNGVAILTGGAIAAVLGPLSRLGHLDAPGLIDPPMILGAVAYGTIHAQWSAHWRRPSGRIVAALALAFVFLVAPALGATTLAVSGCSALAALGAWTLVVWAASQIGFDVYSGRDERA
jgi:hypothetical protein